MFGASRRVVVADMNHFSSGSAKFMMRLTEFQAVAIGITGARPGFTR